MKIAILGAGAVGCYMTTQFATHSSQEIFLLTRSNYYSIKLKGIQVTERTTGATHQTKNFLIFNNIVCMPKCDIVILAVKASQYES